MIMMQAATVKMMVVGENEQRMVGKEHSDDDKDGDRDGVGGYKDEIWAQTTFSSTTVTQPNHSPPSSLSKRLVRLSFKRPEERDSRYALSPAPPALLTGWTAGATSQRWRTTVMKRRQQ
jgi:hypothetical protein